MSYRGRVENGVVVLEAGARLREGTDVSVEPLPDNQAEPRDAVELRQLRDGLLEFSGIVKGGPSDLARNHDHYLHGTPPR